MNIRIVLVLSIVALLALALNVSAEVTGEVSISVYGSGGSAAPGYSPYLFGCTPYAANYYVNPSSWLYVEPQVYPGFSYGCGNGYYGYDLNRCFYSYPGNYYMQWYYYGIPCGGVNVYAGNNAQWPSTQTTIIINNNYGSSQPVATPEPVYCSDGTPAGFCSSTEPQYCTPWGELKEKASLCGCPAGQEADGNHCVPKKCADGTVFGQCNANHLYCDYGILRERADICGCQTGEKANGQYCEGVSPWCVASVAPETQRAGKPVLFITNYFDLPEAPANIPVSCGDGKTVAASCIGTAEEGYCFASCTYADDAAMKNFRVAASFTGAKCSAQVSIIPALPTSGGILAKVTDCKSGAVMQSAFVSLTDLALSRHTDKNGEALFENISSGAYSLTASFDGYDSQTISANGVTGRISVAELCLSKHVDAVEQCDIAAELVSQANCPTGPTQNFQVKLTNLVNATNNVTATYSAAVPLAGPVFIPLNATEARLLSINATLPSDYSGAYLAIASFKGNKSCSVNVQLPLCMDSGVQLTADDTIVEAMGGEDACFPLMLRNRGNKETIVQLQANGDWTSYFDITRVYLAAHETRAVKFCAKVPTATNATGQHDFTVTAQSPINDAKVVLTVKVPSSTYFSSDFGTKCRSLTVSQTRFYQAINLTNNGLGGDFDVEVVGADGVPFVLTQSKLYNFVSGTQRTVYVSVIPADLPNLNEAHATIYVSKQGTVLFQQDLCFRKSGGSYSAFAQLVQTHVTLEKGQLASAFIRVRNTGASTDKYYVTMTSPFTTITASPKVLEVAPKDEGVFELTIAPSSNSQAGEYAVPIQVFSQYTNDTLDVLVKEETLRVTILEPPRSSMLNATLAVGAVSFEAYNGSVLARFNVTVSNFERDFVQYNLTVDGLPEGWSYAFDPVQASVPYGQTKTFVGTIFTTDLQALTYNATIDLRASDGRLLSVPISISGEKAKEAGLITGFFTLGGANNLLVAILVVLILVGIFVYYKTKQTKEEMESGQSAAQ